MQEVDNRPRYFAEINEPFLVGGLNLNGFAPAFIMGAVFAGLQLWIMLPFCFPPFVILARRMAKEPEFLKELGAKLRESRPRLTAFGDRSQPIVVILPQGAKVGAADWGQFNAFRAAHPKDDCNAALASALAASNSNETEQD
jgi:hypothetical protein